MEPEPETPNVLELEMAKRGRRYLRDGKSCGNCANLQTHNLHEFHSAEADTVAPIASFVVSIEPCPL